MKLDIDQTTLAVFIGALVALLTSTVALVHAKEDSHTCTITFVQGKTTHVHIGRVNE